MPVELDDVGTLQRYLAGVVRRADHHADNIKEVVLPLIGVIVLFKDADQKIEVLASKDGDTKNVLWVHIGGKRYAFSYDHVGKSVVMRRGTTQGAELAHFDNATTVPQIMKVFEAL